MDDLSSTTGIVALAAGGLALIALIAVLVLVRALRRLRADQRAILGGSSPQDLVAHAAELDRGFALAQRLRRATSWPASTRGSAAAEGRLDGAIAFHGLVRYDAYNEMSGRQSTSIALLDSRGSGIVISSIHHRDQARLYAKQVVAGRARARALARGGGGDARRAGGRGARRGRAPPAPLVVMRLGYLGPARHVQRGGGAPGHRRARAPSSCPSARSTRP